MADARTIAAPPGGFAGPVKRSITIAGHQTSISLEPLFWQALEAAAVARALPLSALVAQIDALRIGAPDPPNLASALRTWLIAEKGSTDKRCDKDENSSQ
jgi:predicted DNA-binding ribbon-helix-helix protein